MRTNRAEPRDVPIASPCVTAPSDLIGARYRLIERLGKGGAAEVWRARDEQLGRTVALKFLRRDADDSFRRRFASEARRAAAVSHPNAVLIYDTVDHALEPYIVMELVDGRPLDAILRERGRLRPAEVADVITGIAGALEVAHAAGIIHCDVKPANILIDKRGTAKLADFGIARASRTDGGGQLLGTAGYVAPERLKGAPATPRTDVYGLGLVAYEMLVGRPAFDAEVDLDELRARILTQTPRLGVEVTDIAATVENVVARAMDRQPGRRYSAASGFARAFANAVRSSDRTEVLRRFTLPRRVGSRSGLGHLPIVLGGVLALGFVGGLTSVVSAARASYISSPTAQPRLTAPASATTTGPGRSSVVAGRTTANVVGMPAKDAANRLRELGFRNDIEITADPTASGRRGTVLRQEPAAGSTFKPGQRAKLVVIGRYDDD